MSCYPGLGLTNILENEMSTSTNIFYILVQYFFYYNKYESLPAAGLKYFIGSLAAYFADVFYVM
jgi:hypothetical protein